MCGFPMSLLAGEICRVLLEVENFGQEPLNNLRLASSHHHLLLLEKVRPSSCILYGVCLYTHCYRVV